MPIDFQGVIGLASVPLRTERTNLSKLLDRIEDYYFVAKQHVFRSKLKPLGCFFHLPIWLTVCLLSLIMSFRCLFDCLPDCLSDCLSFCLSAFVCCKKRVTKQSLLRLKHFLFCARICGPIKAFLKICKQEKLPLKIRRSPGLRPMTAG